MHRYWINGGVGKSLEVGNSLYGCIMLSAAGSSCGTGILTVTAGKGFGAEAAITGVDFDWRFGSGFLLRGSGTQPLLGRLSYPTITRPFMPRSSAKPLLLTLTSAPINDESFDCRAAWLEFEECRCGGSAHQDLPGPETVWSAAASCVEDAIELLGKGRVVGLLVERRLGVE